MIILRYLAKEMVKTSAAVLFILLLVAILNKFSSLISKAALGEIPPYLLFELILLHIPELLAFLMPLSLFLGILLALGKLYAEQEMTAYFSCGFGWNGLVKVGASISLVTLLLVSVLTLWVVPIAQNAKESIMAGQKVSSALQTLSQGKFHQVPGKPMVFYFESKPEDNNQLDKLFIAEETLESNNLTAPKTIITAQKGNVIEKEGFWYLELQKGHQYKSVPGEKTVEVLHFEKYGKLLDADPQATSTQYHRNTPTHLLFASTTPSYVAELQWRFSVPMTAPILVIWALCLSRVSPREGRFGKMLPAILLFITYFQLLSLSKRWIISGTQPSFIGLWWVHIVLAGIGIAWLLQQSGYWARKSYAKK
jgi:lipopolysaccharide export system permease protein